MTACPIDVVAVSADALIDLNPEPTAPVIQNVQASSASQDEILALRAEIQAMRRQMGTADAHKAQSEVPLNLEICWYHKRFGDQAKSCKAPCGYKKNVTTRR